MFTLNLIKSADLLPIYRKCRLTALSNGTFGSDVNICISALSNTVTTNLLKIQFYFILIIFNLNFNSQSHVASGYYTGQERNKLPTTGNN